MCIPASVIYISLLQGATFILIRRCFVTLLTFRNEIRHLQIFLTLSCNHFSNNQNPIIKVLYDTNSLLILTPPKSIRS